MNAAKVPRVVVVTRRTEYEALLQRHGTHEQARFFLRVRGQSIDDVEERHARFERALGTVLASIPARWRRTRIDRADLSRFVFEPDDLVVPVGQDGLVANAAKYLHGQPVVGINPDPSRWEGVLVRHPAERAERLLVTASSGHAELEERIMVEAHLDDGQSLLALNEIFVGHRTHQSARYRIAHGRAEEDHSSSGLIVTTGTGASGWARSIVRERRTGVTLPSPEEARLAFFVREAWPSVATGTRLTDGELGPGDALEVVSRMDDGVCFGDGIEADRVQMGWGTRVRVGIADTRLRLVV